MDQYEKKILVRAIVAILSLGTLFTSAVLVLVMKMKMTRGEANTLYRKLAEWAEGREAEPAMDVRDCYDWVNHRPSPEYREKYLRVKDDLSRMGLQFD